MQARINRKILLPRSLDTRIKNLAELQQETNGILLYVPIPTREGFDARVDALYMTNVGTAGHVRADSDRMRIANRFFQNNPEYRFVKWHTHCRGTGESWFTRLSQGDIDSYEAQLREDSRFIGMMASPIRTILYGRGDLSFALVDDTTHSAQYEQQVSGKMQRAAREIGFDTLPRLKATR